MAFAAIRKQGTDMSEQYANRQEKGQLRRLRNIQAHIFYVCGQYVMLEDDLVLLLALKKDALSRTVRRHPEYFSGRFCFPLSDMEYAGIQASKMLAENALASPGF